MERISLPFMDGPIAQIGFGCASLGSRVDRAAGRAALARAFERGIRWFDVAPSYGDGEAEEILGEFFARDRHAIGICTKVGYRAPRSPILLRALRPAARALVAALPRARTVVAKARSRPDRLEMTGASILASLEQSLRRLRTGHVEVLALHEPTRDEIHRDDVLRTLEAVVSAGKARTIGIAGAPDIALEAIAQSPLFGVVQVADSPFAPNVRYVRERMGRDRRIVIISHSIFGVQSSLARLADRLRQDRDLADAFAEAGWGAAPHEAAAGYLLAYALASNPGGLVLISMFNTAHFDFNTASGHAFGSRALAIAQSLGASG